MILTTSVDERDIDVELYLQYMLRNNSTERLVQWIRTQGSEHGEVLHRLLGGRDSLCTQLTRQLMITELFRYM